MGDSQPKQQTDEPPTLSYARTPPETLTFREVVRRLGPAGPWALISSTVPLIGGFAVLYVMPTVGPWLQSHEGMGVALYIAGFALFSGMALLPTYAQSTLGGWAFQFRLGAVAAILGTLGGSLIGYGISRRAAGDRVVELIGTNPKWQAVYVELLRSGTLRTLGIVTLLRLPPNSPFAVVNLLMSATKIPLPIYLLGTVLGIAPRTAAAAFIGAGLSEIGEKSPAERWLMIAGIVVTIIAVIIIGHLAKRALSRMTGAPEAPVSAPAAE